MLEKWTELAQEEQLYKKLYKGNPSAYLIPVESWEDFHNIYRETAGAQIPVPDEAPTYMDSFFTEESLFFPELQDEVTMNRHSRYSPAFWHSLSFIKLAYVLKGRVTFFIDQEKIMMQPGDFCMIGPNVRQAFLAEEDDSILVNILVRSSTFSSSFSGLLMEKGSVTMHLWQILYNKTNSMAVLYSGGMDMQLQEDVLRLCAEVFSEPKKSNLIRKCLVHILYAHILRLHEEQLILVGQKKRGKPYYIPEVMFYIRSSMKGASLQELADRLGVTSWSLSRYIKKETGLGFVQHLNEFRMARASEMLRSSNISLEKIIADIGYTDRSQFYRQFKDKFGISPAKYRKTTEIIMY